MKLGVSAAAPPADGPFEDWKAHVSSVEETGFDLIGMGDLMTRSFECHVQMTLLAIYSNLPFGSTVTNPVTRHPAVVASAFASVQKVSGGRALLGIGTGNSGVRNLGLKPAKLDDLRDYIACVRSLWSTGEGTYRGRRCNLPWAPNAVPEGVPVYIAADGPRTLELAGEIADGVFVGGGFSDSYLAEAYGSLERGAAKSGRQPDDLDIWFIAELVTGPDDDEALDASLNSLAALCSRTFRSTFDGKAAPPELQPALEEFNRRYDYSGHITGENAALLEELDLKAFLADRFLVAGTPEAVVERLEKLQSKGVPKIFLMGISQDTEALFRDLKQVIPAVR